jgi:hypothetical protein
MTPLSFGHLPLNKGETERGSVRRIILKVSILILLIPAGLITNLIYGQTYSEITYDVSTSIEIQSGADVCATNIYINGTYLGGGTICTGALPVTILSFTASVEKNNVQLFWTTETEVNNSGFRVERMNTKDNNWKEVWFIQGHGTASEPHNYTFTDKKLQSSIYKYRLKQIDFNGNYEYFSLENDVIISAPNNFSISQNYPNPSNPKSKIDYEIPLTGKVSIKLYDMLGREVLTLVSETKEAGYYTAEFDGTNLASGVYFYRIIAEGSAEKFSNTLKMILLR